MGRLSNALFWGPVARGLRAAGLLDTGRSDFQVLREMREVQQQMQGYRSGYTDRLTKSWGSVPVPIDALLRDTLGPLRARAREISFNSDWDRKFDLMVRSNVVGSDGIRLQMKLRTLDGKPDRVANSAIEKAWNDWSRPENCDVCEQESFVSMQSTAISTVRRDGEVVVRRHVGRKYGKYRFQVQLIDAELLDARLFEDLANGNKVRFGIEFSPKGKPVAYYFRDEPQLHSPLYAYGYGTGVADHIRVPADEITLLFTKQFVGQKRGIPWSATSLFRMKMLDGYEEAAVVAARVGAAKMGFFKTEDGRGLPLKTDASSGAKVVSAKPGGFQDLPPNASLETWDPQYPHEQFDSFVRSQLRGIASGLGVSYAMLANDLADVNFSSIRAAILEDREIWKGAQRFLVDRFNRPTFEGWLFWAMSTGKIVDETGGIVGVDRYEEARENASFVPRGWGWVDPLKEAKAATEAINNGTGTRSQFIREAGRDPVEVFEEAEFENAIRDEKGLSNEIAGGIDPEKVKKLVDGGDGDDEEDDD